MDKMMKITLNKLMKNEKGQALPIVLILLLIGGLIIGSLLGFMSTGVKAGQIYEERMEEFYAADAGVEDGLWQMKYNPTALPEYGDPPLVYSLADMNDKQVTVEIAYTWLLEGLESDINGTTPHAELLTLSRANPATGVYDIDINYDGSTGNVWVERIGVWLPMGFSYDGSSWGVTTDDPVEVGIAGGTALIWDLTPRLKLETGVVTTETQSFNFTPLGSDLKGNFAWVRTTRNDIYLSWDGAVLKYAVTATATDSATSKQTEVVADTFWDTDAGDVGITTWEVDLQ